MNVIVDISNEAAQNPAALDKMLEPLYFKGFMTQSAKTPTGEHMVANFIASHGTSPAYLLIDEETRTVGLTSFDSPSAKRALNSYKSMTFERAIRHFA